MIRAGRTALVRTVADLAASAGVSRGTFLNNKPYRSAGYPAPISSAEARVLLWDGEQIDAYHAGQPIPPIDATDRAEDLLDRNEAAAVLEVDAKSWDALARKDELLVAAMKLVANVKHWPRTSVTTFKANRPGKGAATGRAVGSGDMVPRDEIIARIEDLLDRDPAITGAAVRDELGLSPEPTQNALARLRGRRMADLVEAEPDLSLEEAAKRLGYPPITRRGASAAAEKELHSRPVLPYLRRTAAALTEVTAEENLQVQTGTHGSTHGGTAAAIVLGPASEVAALVWDERYGWRTAGSRRHPFGGPAGAEPPTGAEIRYFGADFTPTSTQLLAWLRNPRAGRPTPPRRRKQ